jgi:hypothetical protein
MLLGEEGVCMCMSGGREYYYCPLFEQSLYRTVRYYRPCTENLEATPMQRFPPDTEKANENSREKSENSREKSENSRESIRENDKRQIRSPCRL